MTIHTSDPSTFEYYFRLLLHSVVTAKDGRHVLMYTSHNLIHLSKNPKMRQHFYDLHKMLLQKFYEYTGPEYPFEFVMKLKKAFMTPGEYAKKIQRAFRKSREYAAWAGHPDRLKAQGFFEIK
ncbi:hypothetical protein EBX93_04165 [bacterium]|nr:hypothetical protein [bacterium]